MRLVLRGKSLCSSLSPLFIACYWNRCFASEGGAELLVWSPTWRRHQWPFLTSSLGVSSCNTVYLALCLQSPAKSGAQSGEREQGVSDCAANTWHSTRDVKWGGGFFVTYNSTQQTNKVWRWDFLSFLSLTDRFCLLGLGVCVRNSHTHFLLRYNIRNTQKKTTKCTLEVELI